MTAQATVMRHVLIAAVAALALLQILLTWEFWASFAPAGTLDRLVFQGIGVTLSLIEVCALVVAGHAADRGEKRRAFVAVLIFAPLFLLNLTSDIGALATLSAGDTARREQTIAAYDANQRIAADADAEIARLRSQLAAAGLDRPAAALRPEWEALAARQADLERQGLTPTRRTRTQTAALASALATATAIEQAEARRDQALAANTATGARPGDAHPQFETFVTMLGWVGIQTTTDEVRLGLAFAIGLVVKLWLALGFWAAATKVRPAPTHRPSDAPASGPAEAPSKPQSERQPEAQPSTQPEMQVASEAARNQPEGEERARDVPAGAMPVNDEGEAALSPPVHPAANPALVPLPQASGPARPAPRAAHRATPAAHTVLDELEKAGWGRGDGV